MRAVTTEARHPALRAHPLRLECASDHGLDGRGIVDRTNPGKNAWARSGNSKSEGAGSERGLSRSIESGDGRGSLRSGDQVLHGLSDEFDIPATRHGEDD